MIIVPCRIVGKKYLKGVAVDTNGVNLSKIYENTEEGFSFKYPSAYELLGEEELASLSDGNESVSPLVVLANEIDDLPEANTYIMVSKFSATQDVIDHPFIDDEQFAATFDNDSGRGYRRF